MNHERKGMLATLAGCWALFVKAFAASPRGEKDETYGADTTLFGTEQTGAAPLAPTPTEQRPEPDPSGESSYLADEDLHRRDGR